MSRMTSHASKVSHASRPGITRHEERPRTNTAQLPIHIAPRPKGFNYNALKPGEIRLLNISPSQDHSAPIRSTMLHRPLTSSLSGTYEARSDVWESQEPREAIHVNEEPMAVSQNLLEDLRNIRSPTESKTLWVECICVNKNDPEEKREQETRTFDIICKAGSGIALDQDSIMGAITSVNILPSTRGIAGASSDALSWKSLDAQMEEIGSECAVSKACQFDRESLPALTSTPGSPLTNSVSLSPVSVPDFASQATPSLDGFSTHPMDPDLWITNTNDCDLHQLSPGDDAKTPDTSTTQRKRSLLAAFSDDVPTPSNRKVQQTQPINTDNNDKGANVAFACPFQKFDPHKYHRCLKYTLNRIKDVKQHIYRQHTQPPYYCARCYTLFPSPDQRDDHSRQANCQKRDSPGFEGISEDQRIELKKSSPRKKPLQEQWFEVWEIIFQGQKRPQSAFIGNYVEEMIPLLRNLWNKKGSEIISGVVDARDDCTKIDHQVLADIMGSVFNTFEEEATRASLPGASIERTCSSDVDSFQHITKESDFCFDLDEQDLSQFLVPDFDTACAVDFGNYYYSP